MLNQNSKNSFIEEFISRGFLHQSTNLEKLKDITSKEKISAYIGFDLTAKSLHAGNLIQIMILRMLQKHGHKPIIIVGGGTTKIGDPSGKDEARKMLSQDDINENIEGIRSSLSKFLNFGTDSYSDAVIINNNDWLNEINYIDFLRDYGSCFSINRMLTMDSVKLRLEREQHLSFLEFNYMLLQAYDFLQLNRKYNCILQLGGSDQWGNIIQGVELIRRIDNKEAFGITTPLLTTSSGAKMGKTAQGALWLDAKLCPPYDYFQYWRNIEDLDVMRFAKLYTEFSDDEFLEFSITVKDNINEAKKKLAFEITKICHGEEEAKKALETSISVFENSGIDGLEKKYFSEEEIKKGIVAFELFFQSGMVNSKSEARNLIRGKGAKINDSVINNENDIINEEKLIDGYIKLSAGKKKHLLIGIK